MRKMLPMIALVVFFSQILSAQTKTVFYNEGIIVSVGVDNNHCTVYVNGDMQVSTGTTETSQILIDKSRMKLTGDFINDVARGANGGIVFETPTSGNEGVFEFCGTSAQNIMTTKTTNADIPSKRVNYINFPNLDINNSSHVTVMPQLAVRTNNIELSKGWLILDSDIAKANVDGGVNVSEDHETVLAHLLVDGSINYNRNQWASLSNYNERGFIQVNLKVPGESAFSERSIVGFGSPFKEMRSDYFMFNTLLEPLPAGFLAKAPITDPKTTMVAGKGYVVGIDLRGTDSQNYPPLPEYEGIIDFNQRATNGYQFNRHAFNVYAPSNQVFGADPSVDAYQNEVLNTEDVKVTLEEGFNYLSNPFTSPLNIDKLLGLGESYNVWGVDANDLSFMPQLRNRVWILAPNSVAEPTAQISRSKYTYNYQVAMRSGGTYQDADNVPGVTSIAPLQMFVVRAYPTAVGETITIPKSERVMGTSRFIRSTPVDNKRRDDFVLEFRNKDTRTTDRVSVVLRTKVELESSKYYTNVERLVSTSTENGNGSRTMKTITSDFEQSIASQIYTKDTSGKPLTVQFFPIETTQAVELYHIPSSQAQPLEILGLRIDTKDKVYKIWLEDRLYNTKIEVTPDMLYKTYSNPADRVDRFVIHFNSDNTGVGEIEVNETKIYAYQQDRDIIVQGFIDSDTGNTLELIDINGRRSALKRVDSQQVYLSNDCIPGAYIIKMSGSRTQTFKILVK